MAVFNFKQAVYAGMIAVAGVDEKVTTIEKKNIDAVFDRFMKLSKKEKAEVINVWEPKTDDEFTDLLVDELKAFSKRDQIEAFTYVMRYISWSKTQYNKTKRKLPKGVDPERAELNMYYDRAEKILKELDFSPTEYEKITRTGKR